MATGQISRETAKTLADTVKMVKEIGELDKKIQSRYAKTTDGLRQGMGDQSPESIDLYRPQLGKVVDDIEKCLNMIQGAVGLLSQLQKDEALMEGKFTQIEALVKTVAGIRKRLAQQMAEARKLDAEAGKAEGAIEKGQVSLESDLGALKNQVESFMKAIRHIDQEAPKLAAEARKQHAAGNLQKVTDARVRLIDFGKQKTGVTAMKPRLDTFEQKYREVLTREQKAELQHLRDDLERAAGTMDEVGKAVVELLGLKAPAKADPKAGGAGKGDAKGGKADGKGKANGAAKPIPDGELKKLAKDFGLPDKEAKELGKVLLKPRKDWKSGFAGLKSKFDLKPTADDMMKKAMSTPHVKSTLIDL